MRLLIGVIQGEFITYYFWGPRTKRKLPKQTHDELDLTLKQPDVQENLIFWENMAQQKKSYGLLILIDNNKGTKNYAPIETKEEFEKLLSLGQTKN